MDNQRKYCWYPDDSNVFGIAEILSESGDEYTLQAISAENLTPVSSRTFSNKSKSTFIIDSTDELLNPPSDLIQLIDVHRPGILHTLRHRFQRDKIYTSVGPILIALNPFRWISGLYEEDIKMKYYRGLSNLSENPHVFAMAHDALIGLQFDKNQSLIISGESGAGKTEATKQCLNYLATVAGSSSGVQERILLANPILESWGNAKTLRNNNSSRFGKFIEILLSVNSEIVGASNTTYLLEKSRVVFQEQGERSYHIFYQLLFGAPDELISELGLAHFRSHPDQTCYINQSGCLQIEGIDDTADFREMENALSVVGFSDSDISTLHQIIAAILHLGNILFSENPSDSEGCVIANQPENFLIHATRLLGVDAVTFNRALLFKSVRSGSKRKSVTFSPYTPKLAVENRDALAKEIYSRCFDFIVEKINSAINADPQVLASMKTNMIGVLDIFGFEIFKKNSFEQLCINLANEALQRHFNVHIFQAEMEVYLSEDIVIPNLTYNDNQDVLDLIIKKPKGMIPMLDEEGQVPRGTWEGFLSKFTKQHAGTSKRLKYRQGMMVFTLVHYAGDVTYDPSLFITKNKDTLSPDLVEAMITSTCPLLATVFEAVSEEPNPSGRSSAVSSKLTVGTKFRIQLDSLMSTLDATEPRYIRCIKPNSVKKAHVFESALTNEQLTYSGVFEAVIIMQNGYPFRLTLREFRNRYHMLCANAADHSKIFRKGTTDCNREHLITLGASISILHVTLTQCHIGRTMVFYRAEQHRVLESMRRAKVDNALHLLQKSLRRFVARNLYVLLTSQKSVCTSAILNGNVESMKTASREIESIKLRILRVYMFNIGEQECSKVAAGYSSALAKERQLTEKVQKFLHDSTATMFEIFDPLNDAVSEAKELCFTATLGTHSIRVVWSDNPVFVTADKKVQGLKKIIDVKVNLDKGLKDNDEIALKHWLDKLKDIRASGDVESKFCKDEEVRAQTIVKTAQEIFELFLSTAHSAISTGRLVYDMRNGSGAFEDILNTSVTVDPCHIQKFLSDLEKKGKDSGRRSMQRDNLVKLSRELCTLRECAKAAQWSRVWELLNNWTLYLASTGQQSEDVLESESSHLVPLIKEVEDIVREEIQSFFICSISETLFRQLVEELKKDHIPSSLTLETITSDVGQLEEMLAFLSDPKLCTNMNNVQIKKLQAASIKGRIRKAIISGDVATLRSLLNSEASGILVPSDIDITRGLKWQHFFDTLEDLVGSLRHEGPSGTAGCLKLTDVAVTNLQKCLLVCNGLQVRPEREWEQIVSAATAVRDVRAWCCEYDMKKASELLQSLKMSADTAHLFNYEQLQQLATGSDQMLTVLQLATNNMIAYEKEIDHVLAKQELLDCVEIGMVSGEVGELLVENVETKHLELVLSNVQDKLIPTPEVETLVHDCHVLIELRSYVLNGEWDSILDKTNEIFESSNSFGNISASLRKEFEVLYGEAQDLQSRRKMMEALSTEILFEDANSDLVVLETAKDQTELRDAILFSKSQKKLSFEARCLLTTAELVLLLREAVMFGLWEEHFFGLMAVSASEIAYVLQDRFGKCSPEEIKDALNMLLLPWRKIDLGNIDEAFVTAPGLDFYVNSDINVHNLLCYSQQIDIHECALEEVVLIRRIYVDRRCRVALLHALSVGNIKGTVEYIDHSSVSVDLLLQCLSFVTIHQLKLSKLTVRWLNAAIDILDFRYAVGDGSVKAATSVELSTYFDIDFLKKCKAFVACSKVLDGGSDDLFGFPVTELKLIVDHCFDCLSIADLASALHAGRPQFYNGKFDTTNVAFAHLESALLVAKKCENRSDRLDRLMFYAELCCMLRSAIISHRWDLSESGERTYSLEPKRGSGVKQCLLEYQQANQFFQHEMEGIPPRTLKDEFLITQREWERRLILQGFPSAFQSGRINGINGNIILHQVRYQRLVDQIERAKAWSEQASVQDPDLYLLIKAGQEIVNVRKRALDVHAKYKREAHFKKATNSIRDIIMSDFISEAMFTAIEKVEGLLVHPYPMTTEWMLVDQAVSKMDISARLQSTKMQVELVGMETFERGFNSNAVRALHSLDEFKDYPPEATGAKLLLTEMRSFCELFRARSLELNSRGSVKPSDVSQFLYVSCVVLIHLLHAELDGKYEEFNRDWLSKTNSDGVICIPSLQSLCSNLNSPDHTVQSVLRTASKMSKIHPSATIQIIRLTTHVENEITVLELSEGLSEGAVTGTVGHVRHERISSLALGNALNRAIMFALRDDNKEEEEFRELKRYSVGVVARKSTLWVGRTSQLSYSRGSSKFSPFRSSARFRYSSRYTSNQIAYIELSAGLREGCVEGGVGRVMYDNISDDVLKAAIEKAEVQAAHRPDVVKLRHTCEIMCELREAVSFKNYQKAFDVLNSNIGSDGQTFKELLNTIYSADFTIHSLAVNEFTLIALETCESYWRFAAKGALIRGVVRGMRCCFQLSEVNCEGIDEVLDNIEGLIEISKASIVIRELCFMVKHMRKSVVNAVISHDAEETFFRKRKEPIPFSSSVKLLSIMKLNFVDDAINNALMVVEAISPVPYNQVIATNYAKFLTIENIANHVKECIIAMNDDNLIDTHRNILLKECALILSFSNFYTVTLTLERVLNMEGMWYSFSTSRLEIDTNIKTLLHQAVKDAVSLAINTSIPAEAMWHPLVEIGKALWDLVELIDLEPSRGDRNRIGTSEFTLNSRPVMNAFLKAVEAAIAIPTFVIPAAISKQVREVQFALDDDSNYHIMMSIICDPSNFSVQKTVNSEDSPMSIICISEYAEVSRNNKKHQKILQETLACSIICSWLKNLVDFHLKMRNAILEGELHRAKILGDSILVEQTHEFRCPEVELVLTYCATAKAILRMTQGLVCCVLPPVPGWSDYSNASAIAFSIADYPLRQALDSCSSCGDSSDNYQNIYDPKLSELITLGRSLISLVCAVRRRTWDNEELHDDASGVRRESLLRADMFTMLFPIDTDSTTAGTDDILRTAYSDVFCFSERDVTVKEAISRIQQLLANRLFLSASLSLYLENTLQSATVEQRIYELSKVVKDALSRQQIMGLPGHLRCTQDSIDFVNAALRKLDSEISTVQLTAGLKRSYLSLKLCMRARLAVIKQDWEALGPIVKLYQFMSSLDHFESHVQCTELMHLPVIDDSELLTLHADYFDSTITKSLSNFADNLKFIANMSSSRQHSDFELEVIAKDILGLDTLSDVLLPIPEIEAEMLLLEKHHKFEMACRKFAMALQNSPAIGKPGELQKGSINYDMFYQVMDILRESGLLRFPTGERLQKSCAAMISLRLGQCSGRLEDIKSALTLCKIELEEESKITSKSEAPNNLRKYLSDATNEIDLASQDFVQQEIAQMLYNGILSNRLPLTEDIALRGSNQADSNQSVDVNLELSETIRECIKRGVTSKRGKKLLNTARLLLNIRKNISNRDWVELKALYDELDITDNEAYDSIAIEEVEAAKRLLVVSSAVDMAAEAIAANRIKGLVGDIDVSVVSVSMLERSKLELLEIKTEWISSSIYPYILACNALIPIRSFALKEDWVAVYDYASIELEKAASLSPITPTAGMEIQLARDHAAYVISRNALVDALSNGRMEGDVGDINTSTIFSSTVEQAIQISQKMEVDHPDIQRLEASARIIYDIRRAQQCGKWMSDPSSRRRMVEGKETHAQLPDADTMITTMALVPISGLKAPVDPGMQSLSKLLHRYISRKSLGIDKEDVISRDFGSVGWLMESSTVDSDTSSLSSLSLHSVNEVLEGAAFVERALGIADEAFPEIAFAREELKFRHIIHMLLSAMTSAGYKGVPGNLDAKGLDLYPLERSIRFAENNSDVSDRGACRWILRDAKVLYRIRKARSSKDWGELSVAVQEAISINTCSPPPLPELNNDGEEVNPEPIIPSVWHEITLIRADMLFYKRLSEFAQEMTNRIDEDSTGKSRHKEKTDSLTTLLQIILRSQAAAELFPSPEFDRLIEAQRAALELRTHMTFDSAVSPRKIILNVGKIKDRDKQNGHTSYICLLMPDISQLSDVLDMEQLVETLEKGILKDQVYLRCPIGHIDANEIDLEYLRLAIQSAMPLLNVTGSKEHLNLLSLTTAMLAIRTEVVSQKWSRVMDLIVTHESVLAAHSDLVKEEISRLLIEGENDEACRDMHASLEKGRLTNVLALVTKISRHRSASMTAISANIDFDNVGLEPDSQFTDIDSSIEKAIAIRHRSDTTAALLRASVLIRALRSAIASGDWDEVQQIVSDESNYTRMPPSSIEEIRAAKAALHYRNCMSTLSKGLISGAASGVPGKINLSAVDCTTLQTAMSQAEVLDVSDPATAIMLEIGKRICDLRQAVVASHWFTKEPTPQSVLAMIEENRECAENEKHESSDHRRTRLRAGSEAKIRVTTSVPFSNVYDDDSTGDFTPDESDEEDVGDGNQSVEKLLADFKRRRDVLSDLRAILSMRTAADGENSVLDQNESDDEDNDSGGISGAPDWVEHQLQAIKSVQQEVKLLENDLRERKRQELVVSALENIPIPVRQFSRAESESESDGENETVLSNDDKNGSSGGKDVYFIQPLADAISAAKMIDGEVPLETAKLITSAELILRFRKTMKSMEIESFKKLLDEANSLSASHRLSIHYGVFELNSYRSVTMTITLAKSELVKALNTGKVGGTLNRIDKRSIDTHLLSFWVSSCSLLMESTRELSMGLQAALQEAQIMLALREYVRDDNWEGVAGCLSKHADKLFSFEFAALEIQHIQFASKYRQVSATISDLVSEPLPEAKEDQCAYVGLKIQTLETALLTAEAVMTYQGSLQPLEAIDNKSPPSLGQAESNEFLLLCLGAKSVLELWKAIEGKVWKEESIAAGQVHMFPRPSDSLLNAVFESVRQHEVAQRLGAVHDQLQFLQIDGEKKIKNIRQSIRASISLTSAYSLSVKTPPAVGFSTSPNVVNVSPSPVTPSPVTPSPVTARRSSTATPVSVPLSKGRRSSLSADASPSTPVSRVPFQRKPFFTPASDSLSPSTPSTGSESSNDAHKFVHLPSSPSRRRSMGTVSAIALQSFDSETQLKSYDSPVMTRDLNESMRITNSARGGNRFLSTPAKKVVDNVANVLCSHDWKQLPLFARRQFEQARNILIDRVVKLRLTWGCSEGAAEEGNYGNVSLANVDVELLNVSLADVRRIYFYTNQMIIPFKFSKDVLQHIKVANMLASLRNCVINNNIDGLIQELARMNYLKPSRLADVSLTGFVDIENEINLFERFAYECISEKTVRNVIQFLCSIDTIREKITKHPTIAALQALDKSVKPVGVATQNYLHCCKVGSLLYQCIIASVMCNRTRLKRCEADVITLIQQPDSPLQDIKKEFLQVSSKLYDNALIHAVDAELQNDSWNPKITGDIVQLSSMKTARRRSVLGDSSHTIKPSPMLSAFGGFDETKVEPAKVLTKTAMASMFSSMESSSDSEISNELVVEISPVVASLRSLPATIVEIGLDVAEMKVPASANVGVRWFPVSRAKVKRLKDMYTDIEELCRQVFPSKSDGHDSCIIDPMWILVGQIVLLSISSASDLLLSPLVLSSTVPLGSFDHTLKELQTIAAASTSDVFMHDCTHSFLQSCSIFQNSKNIRIHELSSYVDALAAKLQRLDSEIGHRQGSNSRASSFSGTIQFYRKKLLHLPAQDTQSSLLSTSMANLCDVLDSFSYNISKQVPTFANEPFVSHAMRSTSVTSSIKRRCVAQCRGLRLRIMTDNPLLLKSDETRERDQKNIKSAISSRRRQFSTSITR